MIEESGLVTHARRELQAIGEDPLFIEGYLKVVQAFADMQHSGGSASVAIPTLTRLLSYKELSPLTNNPEEWNEVSSGSLFEEHMHQSVRNSEAFSEDGGETYYLLSECSKGHKRYHVSAKIK
jgi:hypothetical protein